MMLSVYKNPLYVSCANGGVSEQAHEVECVFPGDPIPANPRAPIVFLVRGNLPGYVKIVPPSLSDPSQPARDVMKGGSFAYSSDSRFHRAVEAILGAPSYGAVPIHDRRE